MKFFGNKKIASLLTIFTVVVMMVVSMATSAYAVVNEVTITQFFKAQTSQQAFDVLSNIDDETAEVLKTQIQEKSIFNELAAPQKEAAELSGRFKPQNYQLTPVEIENVRAANNAIKTRSADAAQKLQALTQKERTALTALNTAPGSTIPVPPAPVTGDSLSCGIPYFTLNCFKLGIVALLNIVIYLFGFLLSITAAAFDFAFEISVTHFSQLADPSKGIGEAIVEIWKIGRDISNLFFIFLLTVAALGTIVDSPKINIKKNFANILIVALFINFSLPIGRVVIDINNVLATEFYNKIHPGNCSIASFVTTKLSPQISGQVSNYLDFGNLCGQSTLTEKAPPQIGELNSLSIIASMIGAWFIITTAAFTFLLGALLFLYRTVALIFVLALGPLAFLSSLIPRTEKYYAQWWSELINNSLFAPVYLFLLYFVFKVMNVIGSPTDFIKGVGGDWTGQPFQLAIYYFFIFTMLNGALAIANDLCGKASGTAQGLANWTMGYLKTPYTKTGNALRSGAQSSAAGARDYAARGVVGGAARYFANTDTMKNFASGNGTGIAGRVGRFVGTPAAGRLRGSIEEVGNQSFGQKEKTAAALTAVKQFNTKDELFRQLSSLENLDETTRAQTYEKLSDREKVALADEAKRAGGSLEVMVTKLENDYAQTLEQREKMEKVRGEVKKADETRESKEILKKIGAGPISSVVATPGTATTPAVMLDPARLQKIPASFIGSLKSEARKNADVISNLTTTQLNKLVTDVDDLQSDEITAIAGIIRGLGAGKPLYDYALSNPAIKGKLRL